MGSTEQPAPSTNNSRTARRWKMTLRQGQNSDGAWWPQSTPKGPKRMMSSTDTTTPPTEELALHSGDPGQSWCSAQAQEGCSSLLSSSTHCHGPPFPMNQYGSVHKEFPWVVSLLLRSLQVNCKKEVKSRQVNCKLRASGKVKTWFRFSKVLHLGH